MRMRAATVVLSTMLLLGMGAATVAQEATPAPVTPTVVSTRTFTLDGRYIAMSPDGTWIATFRRDTDELCAVRTASLGADDEGGDGSDATTCISLDANQIHSISIATARWSPDSSRLAFSEDGALNLVDADIWVLTAETGGLVNLTDDGVVGGVPLGNDDADIDRLLMDLQPTWSPDGETIAFARSPWRDGWQGTQIATVRADGPAEAEVLAPVSLTLPFAVYFGMAYAPDGSALYFTVAYPDPENQANGIWRLSLSDGAATQIAGRTDPERGYPTVSSVSPLGDRVLAYDAVYAGQFGAVGSAFAYLDTSTDAIEPITASPPDDPMAAQPIFATFSPDGKWLAFIAFGARVQSALVVRPSNLVGPEVDTVLFDGAQQGVALQALAWGANGVLLTMTSPESGYLFDVSGGNQPPSSEEFEPPSATPASNSPVVPDAVSAGTALVTNDSASLRAAPNPDALVVLELSRGATVSAIGPAERANGFTWIPVRDAATGTIGFVRAELVSMAD